VPKSSEPVYNNVCNVISSRATKSIEWHWLSFNQHLARHQFTLQNHEYKASASASRGVPVYVSVFIGTHYFYGIPNKGCSSLADLGGWLHTKMVYPCNWSVDHPSKCPDL